MTNFTELIDGEGDGGVASRLVIIFRTGIQTRYIVVSLGIMYPDYKG